MQIVSRILVATVVSMSFISCTDPPAPNELSTKIARFAPTTLNADLSQLSAGDRAALGKLVQVAKLMDSIYTRQIWSGNADLRRKLEADQSPEGKIRLHYYNINMSPWASIDLDSAFIDGVPAKKPEGANYYPEDMTKQEFEQWVAGLSAEESRKAKGFFYTIRRAPDGGLRTVPYSVEYAEFLEPAAALLREAADLTTDASLRRYLSLRADAFLSNNYYESDLAWMDLDSPIEPTIGPYEVYMDKLFNYKAAFEAFITIRNDKETANLKKYASYLQDIENNLPIDPAYRNPSLGAQAPIRVVDEVMVGGEAREGIQTAAFNLPNDERVTAERGSKRVMLKNVQEAKFTKVLEPISRVALDQNQLGLVSFESFFTHILAHELMHGLGPHTITVNGEETTVRKSMKELSSAMEEAKADISGLFALDYLIERGVVTHISRDQLYTTFLASVFRTLRFGVASAHGRGMVLQVNFLLDEGGFEYVPETETFRVNHERVGEAVRKLTSLIMTIQAEGDYNRAAELLKTYVVIRPEIQKTLDALSQIPVDIEPLFPAVR